MLFTCDFDDLCNASCDSKPKYSLRSYVRWCQRQTLLIAPPNQLVCQSQNERIDIKFMATMSTRGATTAIKNKFVFYSGH